MTAVLDGDPAGVVVTFYLPATPRVLSSRLVKTASWSLIFLLGVVCGLAFYAFLDGFGHPIVTPDPRQAGLPWGWLAFGYTAQALFTGRMLVQWIASEKKKSSVVPVVFWWLSLFGGLMLLVYFLRRGDPVGVVGQLFGVVVYARNLVMIARRAPHAES